MHRHSEHCSHSNKKNIVALRWAALFTLIICAIECVGGYFSKSLSLMSDAGHMLTDFFAISLILMAMNWSRKPATPSKTFGYYRAEILAALINGAFLIFIAIEVLQETFSRISSPQPISIQWMIPVSVLGLLANVFSAWILHGHHTHLATRSAFYHIMGDLLSSFGVVIAGVIIYFTNWYFIDSIVSLVIFFILIYGAYGILKESVDILMEGTPAHISLSGVRDCILQTSPVKNLHDLHVWSIGSNLLAASAHLIVDPMNTLESETLIEVISQTLKKNYGISHTTFQIETKPSPSETSCN